MSAAPASPTHLPVRPQWLAASHEEALDPKLPVIDSHHHLYDRPGIRYLLDELLADLRCGHNVAATVIVQARSMLRADASPALQPVGETEFANGVAAMSASGIYGPTRACAAIVGQADLTLGPAVRSVLELHLAAAGASGEGGRFSGIRHTLVWDTDPFFMNAAYPSSEDLMETPAFRGGFAQLAPLGLSFDAWLFHHQIPRLTSLARAFPDTRIVLNHCGGVMGIGPYAGRRDEMFKAWRLSMLELAACPNVSVKLSGLGMRLSGFGFEDGERAPSSEELADAWRPWIEACIEAFGTSRCMYGSNFPVDKGSYAYGVGLNALKRITQGATTNERGNIFCRSAQEFYRIEVDGFAR